jgi:hypothetical protein
LLAAATCPISSVVGRAKEDYFFITRIARARPSGGPKGKANPIQKANSNGRRATASLAPTRWPRHRSPPVTTSSAQTTKNATSSGTVVRMPILSNGPPPYVGNPRNVQTSPVVERYRIPYAHGRPKPSPRTVLRTAASFTIALEAVGDPRFDFRTTGCQPLHMTTSLLHPTSENEP